MKINSLTITNFRGYRNTVTIPFENLTVFVGKNDVGKSTILEALDIFFHDGKGIVKLDKTDVNVTEGRAGNQDTIISVEFDDLPEWIILDTTSITTLQAEYLLNERNKLEIVKKYHNGGTPKIFIVAKHPTNPGCSDLLHKKNSELKSIVRDEGIECENQNNNVLLRAAIWSHYSEDLQFQTIEIDAAKEDAKKIWDKMTAYLPVYYKVSTTFRTRRII